MSKQKKEEEEIFYMFIHFPKAPKKTSDREALFNKTLALIEENKESLPVKIISKKRGEEIILDSDDFMFSISFGKRTETRMLINNPDKNVDGVNDIGNNVVSFLNTILGEYATASRVFSSKSVNLEKTTNLAKKIIGITRMAEINKITQQTLNPIGIILEYKINEREFTILNSSNKTINNRLACNVTYKERLPFNILRKEYEELNNQSKIIKILTEAEL